MINTTILLGKPGVGKTSFPEYFSEQWGGEFYYYLCHEWTNFDEMTYEVDLAKFVKGKTDEDVKGQPFKDKILLTAIKKSKRKKVVVVIDELDKARDKVDTLLLDFIQNCRVTDYNGKLVEGKPENMRLFITTNQNRELQDPLLRRGFKYYMTHLPEDVEKQIIMGNGEYYLDLPRKFIIDKVLNYGGDDPEHNLRVMNVVYKIAKKLRGTDHDLSLNEIKNAYDLFRLCESIEEVDVAVHGWLCRNEDYKVALSRQNKNFHNLVNNIWREVSNGG